MSVTPHPELLAQMDRAGDAPVQAIIQLRQPGKAGAVPSPDESTSLAKQVLERVAEKVGKAAVRSNVLRNLATVVVEAHPSFLRSLVQQPEVISAIPNQTSESPFIPPVGKRPV